MRIGGVDIRRVTGNQLETLPGQRRKPTALNKLRIGNRQFLRVMARQRHRFRLEINAGYRTVGTFAGQRQRNGAGAGTQIENGAGAGRQTCQRLLDQTFGVRPWNQGCGETDSGSDQNSRSPTR